MYKISRIQVYLVILFALALQIGALNYIEILGAKPDLLLILVIFFGLFLGSGAGFESGLAAGLLKDMFAFDFFFLNTFTLALTGLIVGSISNKFFKESKKADFLLVVLFTFFAMSLHYIFVLYLTRSLAIKFSEFFLSAVIPACIYTGLVSVPIYKLLINIYNLKEADDYL